MKDQNQEMMEVLRFNKGFARPENWLEYGIANKFEKIPADKLGSCPDCSCSQVKAIGQFIHYSTLVNLQECPQCRLVYTDTRIDPHVISSHFEQVYKDEKYFLHQRRRIFDQITRIADRNAPMHGKVLDVGGAKGHLLADLKKRRPDLKLVLNDLSKEACEHAQSTFGFETITGGINVLETIHTRFDVIILSDVIYYEPDLLRLWNVLKHLVTDDGVIIIRVPNKLALIRSWQYLSHIFLRPEQRTLQDDIRFFNPEHLYVFSREYLTTRLKSLGFKQVSVIPSKLLVNSRDRLLHSFIYYLSKGVWLVSFGKIILSPSLLIIARKK